jgi:hypothetical protein
MAGWSRSSLCCIYVDAKWKCIGHGTALQQRLGAMLTAKCYASFGHSGTLQSSEWILYICIGLDEMDITLIGNKFVQCKNT